MQPEFLTTGPAHSGQTRMFTVVNGLDGWYRVGRSWGLGVGVIGCLLGPGLSRETEDTPKIEEVKKRLG